MFQNGLPLVALTGTLNAVVSLVIAARLFVSYWQGKRKSHANFLLFYVYFCVFYFTFATSQLIFTGDGLVAGIFHVISYFFLYLAIGYLLSVPCQLTDQQGAARAIVWIMFVFNAMFLVGRIVWFEPSVRVMLPAYIYWQPIFPEWMRVLTGVISVSTAAFVSSFFIRQSMKSRQQLIVFHRSLWLGIGIGVLMLAALLAFIAAPSGSASFVMIATFLVLVGLLATLRGVLYKVPNNHI